MNIDIRLQVSFRDHPKRIRLERRLGPAGPLAMIDLLLAVAQSKPDGHLHGWSDEDIAIAARWNGKPEEFVSTLAELRFLDRHEDGSYSVHDWTEHNSYAAGAQERSERARAAARARWDRQTQNSKTPLGNAESCYPHCCPHSSALPNHAGSNAPTYVPTNIRKKQHTPEYPYPSKEVKNCGCVSPCDETTVHKASTASTSDLLVLVPTPYREAAKRVLDQSVGLSPERVEANIRYANHYAKTNYAAYLAKAIKEDYAAGWEDDATAGAELFKAVEHEEDVQSKRRTLEEQEYATAQIRYDSLSEPEKNRLREETLRANPFLASLGGKTIRWVMLFRLCRSGKLLTEGHKSRDAPEDSGDPVRASLIEMGAGGHNPGRSTTRNLAPTQILEGTGTSRPPTLS
jgi:hypothetical protein